MAGTVDLGREHESSDKRQTKIVDVLVDAFSELMNADPEAFRQKFRKMAAGPFAFYRGLCAHPPSGPFHSPCPRRTGTRCHDRRRKGLRPSS